MPGVLHASTAAPFARSTQNNMYTLRHDAYAFGEAARLGMNHRESRLVSAFNNQERVPIGLVKTARSLDKLDMVNDAGNHKAKVLELDGRKITSHADSESRPALTKAAASLGTKKPASKTAEAGPGAASK